MENKDLIILEQLPIIKYKLEQLSNDIKEKVDKATKLIVSEDTVKDVKQVRASLNKEFSELEEQRKAIKQAIMSKYDEFNEIYVEKVSNLYRDADAQLKEKIDNVENQLKNDKEVELRTFFYEYKETYHLDFVEFEDIGLNITLSASMKSLKDQIKGFCEKVDKDIKIIQNDEYSDEIMLEYKNCNYDYQNAKLKVIERHKQLEEIAKQQEQKKELQEQEQQQLEVLKEIFIPKEVIEEDDLLEITFTIKTTKEKAKLVKQFLNDNEIEVI